MHELLELDPRDGAGHRTGVQHRPEDVEVEALAVGEVEGLRQPGHLRDQEQVHRQLHLRRTGHLTAADRRRAHRCEQGDDRVDGGRRTGHHSDELARLGRGSGPRHRRLDVRPSRRCHVLGQREGVRRRGRAHVHDGPARDHRREARGAAPEHLVDDVAVHQHEEDRVRLAEDLLGRSDHRRTGRSSDVQCGSRPVPHDQLRASPRQVERHGQAHRPETDESDRHGLRLPRATVEDERDPDDGRRIHATGPTCARRPSGRGRRSPHGGRARGRSGRTPGCCA